MVAFSRRLELRGDAAMAVAHIVEWRASITSPLDMAQQEIADGLLDRLRPLDANPYVLELFRVNYVLRFNMATELYHAGLLNLPDTPIPNLNNLLQARYGPQPVGVLPGSETPVTNPQDAWPKWMRDQTPAKPTLTSKPVGNIVPLTPRRGAKKDPIDLYLNASVTSASEVFRSSRRGDREAANNHSLAVAAALTSSGNDKGIAAALKADPILRDYVAFALNLREAKAILRSVPVVHDAVSESPDFSMTIVQPSLSDF